MRSRLSAPALAACIAGFSCGGEPAGPRISETPARLEFVREWLRPSLSPETGETTGIDLMEVPLMPAWHEEVAAELRRIQRMGGGRQWVQGDMHRVDGSSVLVTAGPPDLAHLDTGAILEYRIPDDE